jgi:hypothetical protein
VRVRRRYHPHDGPIDALGRRARRRLLHQRRHLQGRGGQDVEILRAERDGLVDRHVGRRGAVDEEHAVDLDGREEPWHGAAGEQRGQGVAPVECDGLARPQRSRHDRERDRCVLESAEGEERLEDLSNGGGIEQVALARPETTDQSHEIDPEHILAPQRRPQARDLRDAGKIRVAGQERPIDGAHRGADDHARLHPALNQRVHHADL